MTTIQCDNCDRYFKAPANAVGGKTPCPFCGDINRIPSETPASEPKAEPSQPVSAARSSDVGQASVSGEVELNVVRPGMFRAHPFRYALIIVLFLAAVIGFMAAVTTEQVGGWAIWPSLALLLGTLVWFTWWWITAHFWVRLVVSNKRTIKHVGIIKRHTTEVLHDHVRSVDIRQTFLERMFDVGTIGIDSAGQDGIEIEVDDIPHPYEIKKTIDKFRKM